MLTCTVRRDCGDRRLSTLDTPHKELSNFTGVNGGRQQLPAAVIQKTASPRKKPVTVGELRGIDHNEFNPSAHSLLKQVVMPTAQHSSASTAMPRSSKSSKHTPERSKHTSALIVDQHFSYIDVEWNAARELVQFAYIVIGGDGAVIRKVKMLSVRPSNVHTPLAVTKLTVEQLEAGKSLRECRDAMVVGFSQSGRPVGWSFANDVTVMNNDLCTQGMEPLLGDGICALAFAKKIFSLTGRTTKNFTQKEVGVALGITDATLKDHFADDDAVLGSRIFAALLRIADDELHVVTEDQLDNLLTFGALPRQHSSINAGKQRQQGPHQKKAICTRAKGQTQQPTGEDSEADFTEDPPNKKARKRREKDHDCQPSGEACEAHFKEGPSNKKARKRREEDHDCQPSGEDCEAHFKEGPNNKKARKRREKDQKEQPTGEDSQAEARDVAAKKKRQLAAKENQKRIDLAETQRQEHERELMRAALRGAETLEPKDAQKWLADVQKRVDDKEQAYVPDIMGNHKGFGRLLFLRGTHQLHICAMSSY